MLDLDINFGFVYVPTEKLLAMHFLDSFHFTLGSQHYSLRGLGIHLFCE